MGDFEDFQKNTYIPPDPIFDQKIKEMQTHLQQFSEEGQRLEARVLSLSVKENELIAIEKKLEEVSAQEAAKRNSLKELTKKVVSAEGTLIDINNSIEMRKQELSTFNDLSEQITALQIEKSSIESFINDNHISKYEKDFIANQLDALRQELRNLEAKRSELVKEIIQKEADARKLDRDLEGPNKILEEAKHLKEVAESTFKAIEEKERMNNSQQGTIGSYILKLQKKYPNIDFLNIG